MTHQLKPFLLAVCGLSFLFPASILGASAQEIDAAIAKAKKNIYAKQVDGTWELPPAILADGHLETGPTAIALYALLAAGERPDDPRIAGGVQYLLAHPTDGVYALSIRLQIWLLLVGRRPELREVIKREAMVLLHSIRSTGSPRGCWGYIPQGGDEYSMSASQYGVLGLWAAERAGIEIPQAAWAAIETAWTSRQDVSGGWNYKTPAEKDNPFTPGMTAAGVATLFLTQDQLHGDEGLDCKGNFKNPAMEKGIAWLTDHFNQVASDETYPRDYPYATLYAVERVGMASGLKFFSNIDWYAKGADWLVKHQSEDGSWPARGDSTTINFSGVADTPFALLFLARGSAPLMLNKLDYSFAGDGDAPWNERARDAANATRWVGRELERALRWQSVNLSEGSSGLQDAPILYIAGNKALTFDPGQRQKLREFVEAGGLILGNADCGSAAFTRSFTKLGTELFPSYKFRELPASHVIYAENFPRTKWTVKPSVLGIGNGAREFMLVIPQADVGRRWQAEDKARREAFALMGDVFLYMSNLGVWKAPSVGTPLSRGDASAPSPIKVARLQYDGDWNPEPGGWRRLTKIMADGRSNIETTAIKLGTGSLDPHVFNVAHLTGIGPFKLDEKAHEELQEFVKAGGMLIVDAAGGNTEFANAAEMEIAQVWPGEPLQTLPPTHAIYTGLTPPGEVTYRHFARASLGKLRTPNLKGLQKNGRAAVIYSREDISVGLVGQEVDGIIGYDPASATDLMVGMLRYAERKP